MLRLSGKRAIAVYDRVYRFLHRLDTPHSEVGPALRIETCRCYRAVTLSDGTLVRRGARIGALHMNNDRVAALHLNGAGAMAIGLEFRRDLIASLRALAALAGPDQPLAEIPAFVAVTILHHGLWRLGFERDPAGLLLPRVTGAYQRALLATLHPAGSRRLLRLANGQAERLWISRAKLRALYADRHQAAS
jgi:hypothetical protein